MQNIEKDHKVRFFFCKRIKGRKIHFLHGSMAWELQIGRHVFLWYYRDTQHYNGAQNRFEYFTDTYGVR